jgi:Tfp pilus assembly protein PilE
MRFKEQIVAVILAAVLALEGWQLFALYQMRSDVSRIEQKLTDHIQFYEIARQQN